MRTHLVAGLALAGTLALGAFAGCGVDPGAEGEDTATVADALASRQSYVTVRRDLRKCMAPLCGGYFVREVNSGAMERYVSGVELAEGDRSTRELILAAVGSAADGEVVLFGGMGPAEPRFGTRAFVTLGAWRGLPGVHPARGDVYYRVLEPPTACMSGVCAPLAAQALDQRTIAHVSGVDLDGALAPMPPHVDARWLVDRIVHHGALVAGRLVGERPVQHEALDRLDARQVFLRLPELPGPCPRTRVVCPVRTVPAYTRDVNRCLVFDGCIDVDACPILPSSDACADGYTPVRWVAGNEACTDLACDPTFTLR